MAERIIKYFQKFGVWANSEMQKTLIFHSCATEAAHTQHFPRKLAVLRHFLLIYS